MIKNITIYVATVSIISLFVQCAPNLRMDVDDPHVKFSDSGKTIYISEVNGGKKDSFFIGARIDNDEFRSALIASSENSGLFQRCIDEQQPHDYNLDIQIMYQDQPIFAPNNTTIFKVKYTLANAGMEETVFNKLIVTSFAANPKDEYFEADNLDTANAGAVRENIKQFLNYLSTQIN